MVIATIMSWWKEIAGLFAAVMTAVAWVKSYYEKVKPILEPMIKQAEADYIAMIADGKVDKDERKQFVMNQIAVLEKEGKIKLNPIKRWLISKSIDYIAKKLEPILWPVNDEPIPPAV